MSVSGSWSMLECLTHSVLFTCPSPRFVFSAGALKVCLRCTASFKIIDHIRCISVMIVNSKGLLHIVCEE